MRILAVLLSLALCSCMTLTRRLLIAGSGGSFTLPLPEQSKWVRQGTILEATEAWEEEGLMEPVVLNFGPTDWRMWYRGGGTVGPPGSIGYATSTDGIAWTKDAGNPIFGNGAGGEAGNTYEHHVHWDGSQFILFYTLEGTSLRWATSPNGIDTWTLQGVVMALPMGYTFWGNSTIWKEGSDYKGIFDLYDGTHWYSHYGTSAGVPWSISGGPLMTLEVAAGSGTFGAAQVAVRGETKEPIVSGFYRVWYIASVVAGIVPTDIYSAYSADAVTWTINTPNPILTHSGTGFEIDQLDAPHVIEAGGTSYLYFTGNDNVTNICAIEVATFAGTLEELVAT